MKAKEFIAIKNRFAEIMIRKIFLVALLSKAKLSDIKKYKH